MHGNDKDGFSGPQNAQIRVLIADDHTMVSEAVAGLLERQGEFQVETVTTYDGVMRALRQGPGVDLLLLDVRMPGMQGLSSIEQIIAQNDGKTVVFSGYVEGQFVRDAIDRGAAGFIPKTIPFQSLKSAIDLILAGQVFAPMNPATDRQAVADLTEREMMVLRRLAEGVSNKAIAVELDLTEVRVKMHVRQICKKLDVANRTQAALKARDLGMI